MSEPWGFRVQLSALEDFVDTVNDTRQDYDLINGQLTAAHPSKSGTHLLGLAKLPGSTAVDGECRDVLSAYATLYGKVAWAHAVIKAQLDTIAANVTDTHQLYGDVEARHESMFRDLLGESLSEGTDGGEDGSAGQG